MNVMVSLRGADPDELPPGTRLLNGLYEILEPLQKGGFAMTYVARDSLERHVVIKECFPSGICERTNGRVHAISPMVEAQFVTLKQQFLREARGVATLKHPYVVAVHQVFEENNTAYMALDYVEGIDLISVLEDEPQRLTPAFLEATLRETLKAVRHIHANGILHRDIAPDNIRVDGADRITLIDFGAAGARSANPALADVSLPAVKDGYSPPEFYTPGEPQDFSSDIYSLGATFHHLITGQVPPDAQTRRMAIKAGAADPYVPLASGGWNCGYHVLATIDLALQIARERRPQNADQWMKALDQFPKVRPAPIRVQVGDAGLYAAVSKLVRDVNANLKVNSLGRSGRIEPSMLRIHAEAAAAPAQKLWVDIFGSPVGDLATWADQQEALLQVIERAREDPHPSVEAEPVTEPEIIPDAEPDLVSAVRVQQPVPAKKTSLLTLLARCLSRRPETCTT
ncbi:MAG: serine/threonine-protein kinase [Paracoccaceae bacterium]